MEAKTEGESLVGIGFNPSGDPIVQELKQIFARAIDIVNANVPSGSWPGNDYDLRAEAVRRARDAQMWAVKVVTFKG